MLDIQEDSVTRMNACDPIKQTTKYLLTNELTWEATKTISVYSNRWVIEEFFRNAKQLADMERATIRSKQGVTTALCLVSWIDSLFHLENYKQGTAGKLSKESRTIPSIVRQAQYENLKALIKRARRDKDFIPKWLAVEEDNVFRKRKKFNTLISLDGHKDMDLKSAAQQIECQILNFQRTFFRKLKYFFFNTRLF